MRRLKKKKKRRMPTWSQNTWINVLALNDSHFSQHRRATEILWSPSFILLFTEPDDDRDWLDFIDTGMSKYIKLYTC